MARKLTGWGKKQLKSLISDVLGLHEGCQLVKIGFKLKGHELIKY